MTDLQLAPPRESSPLKAILIAAVILAAIAAAVALLNPRKTADLSVRHVQTFAPRVEYRTTPGAVHILGQTNASEDNLYVLATVQLDDKLRLPIFVYSVSGSVTLPDGSAMDATTVAPRDWPRLAASFPAMAPLLAEPLLDGAKASPGGSASGKVLLLFPGLTADVWAKKKSATLQIGLAHQDALTTAIP